MRVRCRFLLTSAMQIREACIVERTSSTVQGEKLPSSLPSLLEITTPAPILEGQEGSVTITSITTPPPTEEEITPPSQPIKTKTDDQKETPKITKMIKLRPPNKDDNPKSKKKIQTRTKTTLPDTSITSVKKKKIQTRTKTTKTTIPDPSITSVKDMLKSNPNMNNTGTRAKTTNPVKNCVSKDVPSNLSNPKPVCDKLSVQKNVPEQILPDTSPELANNKISRLPEQLVRK